MYETAFLEAIRKISKKDSRYDMEAYIFVREALDFSAKMLNKPSEGPGRHLTASELLEGIRRYALQEFGPAALTVFNAWGVKTAKDFGEIVFNLVDSGLLGKTDEDRREDFASAYDFHEAFAKPFLPKSMPSVRGRRRTFLLFLLCLTQSLSVPVPSPAEGPNGFAAISHCPISHAWQKTPAATENALSILKKANSQLNRFVLENGMICLVKEDHSAPAVSIQIWVGTGSIHEQEYLGAGLSHAIEHMIFKGTDARAPGDITREINDAGGNINAYTGLDRTVFHTDLPAENWRVGLGVLADAVTHASFPEGEWKKEKQVILREIAMGRDDPGRVLGKLLWRTAFMTHPYKFPVIGYEQVFRKTTRKDLVMFFRRNYVPDNMITVVVGDINAEEVEAAIRNVFAAFHRRARAPVVLPQEPLQLAPRFMRETGAYKVSRLEWAYHTVPLSHPDAPVLDILAEIVGHGRSSRLVGQLKEKLKLVHSINAWSYTPKEPGLFGITAAFHSKKEDDVVGAVQEEIDSWLDSRFTKKEINKARRTLLRSELSELETMRGQANSYAVGEFYAGDPRFSETYLRQLAKVTPQILQSVARKYFQPKNKTLVVLSPSDWKKVVTGETTSVAAAGVEKVVLSNGLPLLVREDHKLPFVYFCAVLGGGLISEDESNNGISRFMSDLMVRGTKTRSSDEIARTVESLGGTLFPFAGCNSFGLQAKCFSSDTEIFMEILADCLLNTTFPDDEITKQKPIQLAAIDEEHERPFFLAQEALRRILFPNHPYRWSSLGSKETVGKIERADLQAHFKKHVVSGNMVISIFGDITLSEARRLAESDLTKIRRARGPALTRDKAKPQLPARTKRREPKEQTILLAGFPGVDINDPRYDALTILQTAMSGLSSDLAIAVREKRGLAYYVGAYQQAGIEPGVFVVYAGTREDAVGEVEKLIHNEISRIVTGGIRKEEMERARNRIIADYEMSLQNNAGLAVNCALNELYGLGYSHIFTTRQRFEAITSQNVHRAAASVLSTNKLAISLVLPQNKE